MDDKDRILLRELQADSDRPLKEIAKIVGVAGNTLSDRIKRLKNERYIIRIGALVNPSKLEYTTSAIILANFQQDMATTTDDLRKIVQNHRVVDGAQICEVHTLFGRYDVMIMVRAKTNEALMNVVDFLEKSAKLNTETLHVATSVLDDAVIEV